MQLTINYMSSQKNDMFMQRYGFSSSVVISSQLLANKDIQFHVVLGNNTILQCFCIASYVKYRMGRNRSSLVMLMFGCEDIHKYAWTTESVVRMAFVNFLLMRIEETRLDYLVILPAINGFYWCAWCELVPYDEIVFPFSPNNRRLCMTRDPASLVVTGYWLGSIGDLVSKWLWDQMILIISIKTYLEYWNFLKRNLLVNKHLTFLP